MENDMAHGDYHCCALCDCKMQYADYDTRTKEDICTDCLRTLHAGGVMVYTGGELEAWIKANPDNAREVLPGMGYSPCFYGNPVDDAFQAAMLAAQPLN
jgi:hypothetical protein